MKVPAVGALFWVAKLLTTGLGESAGDFLAHVNLLLAAAVGVFGFWAAMRAQLRAPRYSTWTYWTAVLMVAVFGTMAADGVHILFHVPYAASSALFAAVVAVLFARWRRQEGTLSIHSINTSRRERYYWLTVVATFALGTALGDLTASTLHLGFLASVGLFAAAIIVPLIGWSRSLVNPTTAFWSAYVLTRPLGASTADWLGKPHSFGNGLGLGDGPVTAVGLVLFVSLVAYLAHTGRDRQAHHDETAPAFA